jgi:hypothetical protein
MIHARKASLAPLMLALLMAGCSGRSAKEQTAAMYCPTPFTVEDAQSLTRFKPGPGRDPRDIEFQALLTGATTACSIGGGRMEVDLKMRVTASAGPSVLGGITQVPYFVRVIDGTGAVVQGRDFNAGFKLSTANPRGASLEELTLTLYYSKPADLGAYRVAVGLKPTQEELQYNRRGEQSQ